MSLKVETIKRMMGWCPNAKAHEARQPINFESFESGISSRSSGDDEKQKNPGWFRKTSVQTFLITTFFTLTYLLIIKQLGVNLIFLLAGSLVSLFFIIFDWNAQMQRYDAMVKHPVIDYSGKKLYSDKKLYYILAYTFMIVIFYLWFKGQELAMQAIFSLLGGSLVLMWLSYFQLIYWEKMNHKTIYYGKKHGTWKTSYLITEKK
ncbi:Protein of unknown function [Methanosarcina thermophila]|jgi:hypothetical protein|uniref:DUF1673 domain-containing protein n=2 Tax=Methanosarcina TaxID=2207 RepID=A0A1I6X317_METTE|nr:DUF1673 domain-containing protein [Methanosarcina thermophila]ALK04727.1 MAG: hypothetical protein AAY43_02200 [Methanosarcina sp. 795]NLK31526.1 DUF1673 domain-containing protein [Methanosarcina flavescens]SFT32587.1 Protein of unknown function [Methanosarcina thermophila]BAW28428.1 conserved hypothetical protein [Methanosarcina thermophila]HOA67659.1 DUF1673 domain-containing protein [Methanosarcina thermophila]